MGRFAIVQHDIVENIIVLNEAQIEEMSTVLSAELVNALPLGLCIGDLRVGENWTRNINGVQTVLEPLTPEQQIDYTNLYDDLEEKTFILDAAEAALIEGVESIG